MDGPDQDFRCALPGGYRASDVISRRESRLVLRAAPADGGASRILKCLVPPFPAEEDEAFRREFLLLDALRHPCWVRPLRFGSLPDGGRFLEMEEAAGLTLAHWPVRGWWPETLAVAHQVLSGLEVLHRLGYAHLDLGPEQVLVDGPDTPTPWDATPAQDSTRVRLLDLGLAAPFGADVGARGTPGSIAPELLQSRPGWDARADLYSVGTILFELFTGHPAFPGRTVREVLTEQLEGPEPDPGDEAGLPPPVRDLVRELLARDPAARPRSALEVWQRLREQAPRAGAGSLPPFLVAGDEFAFVGREEEIRAFETWIAKLEAAGADETARGGPAMSGDCRVSGEEGIGRRRLAARLEAVAESRGWVRDGTTEEPGLRHPRGGAVRIRVRSRDDEPSSAAPPALPAGGAVATAPAAGIDIVFAAPACAPYTEAVPIGSTIRISVDPMPADNLAQALAAAGIESDVLRRRLAESSLGSPGLLAGLVGVLPREIDFAVRHTGDDRLGATLDALPVPASWLAWARRLLGRLAPADGTALLRAAVAALPGMPDRAALGPPVLPAALGAAASRGLLRSVDGRWRAQSGAWARAIVGADEARTAAIGRELFADLDRPGDEVARARLGLLLHDTDAVAAALPGALSYLAGLGRREEAVILHADAARLGRAALKNLGEEDILELLEGMYGMGTGGGSLLHEPTEWADPLNEAAANGEAPGFASALALLAAWAWLGRRLPDRAAAALRAAEDPQRKRERDNPRSTFLLGWLKFRLFQAQAGAEGAQRALVELRARVSPEDLRRQAWCDGAEAGILEQGRFEQALNVLDERSPRFHALEAGERATYLHMLSIIHYRLGDMTRTAEILDRAGALWRVAGFEVNRLHAGSGIGAVFFQEGNLSRAAAWREDLLREWTTRRRWGGAVAALSNLAQVLLERGHLGEAMRAVEDATALAEHTTEPLAARQVATRRIHLLALIGHCTRAEEEASRFFAKWETLAPASMPFARLCLAEALIGQGRADDGRREFRRAVASLLASGAIDDAADTLAHWGLAETAAGLVAEARGCLAEIEPMRQKITPLTSSIINLLEAEVALSSVDQVGSATVLEAAQTAVASMEAQDRWFLAWRAHWCVAHAFGAAGQAREALASYARARTILMGMVESLATATRTDGFLRLPAVRSFLIDLERV